MFPQHLLKISDLSPQQINTLLDKALQFEALFQSSEKISHTLQPATPAIEENHSNISTIEKRSSATIAHLFFEPSTRTLNSFQLAAQHLDAQILAPNLQLSSLKKGETELDTLQTFAAMGADLLVVRHAATGFAELAAEKIKSWKKVRIINAGDGQGSHPTQALTDLLTIYRKIGAKWPSLKIAVVGDIRRSRVANSLLSAFKMMQVKSVHLIAPEAFAPRETQLVDGQHTKINYFDSLHEGISDCDILIGLRIQKERCGGGNIAIDDYQKHYCISTQALRVAAPDALLMHPGPVNYGIEISQQAAHCSQSLIWEQVRCGVMLRCALLDSIL